MKLIKSHVSRALKLRNAQAKSRCETTLCFSDPHSAALGSDRHRRGGRVAHPHLLLLHNQKMLLQEEEEQKREEGQGWLQHEEHAGW